MGTYKPKIILGFVIISIIWGSTWLAIKIGLESVPPFYAVAIRFTVAAFVLGIVTLIRKEKLPFHQKAIKLYVALAVLSFSFPFALVYWGEQYIPSGLASILFAAYPFVVATGSHFFLPNEPLNPYKIVGIVLGFLGVLVIFWADIQIGEAKEWGMIAILLSTLMQGTSLIVVKRLHTNISATSMTLGGMLFGIVIMYLVAFAFEDFSSVHFDGKGIGTILYLGTLGSVVTFVVYYWLLKHVEAVYLSLVSLVTPVLAVVLGTLWFQESLSPRVFTGAGLVLLGIVIANARELNRSIRTRRQMIE